MEKLLERINLKLDKTSDCWLWLGCKDRCGYGLIRYNYKNEKIHRMIWFIYNKIIPQGHIIRHKCKNKNCCNPDHLETGTMKENQQDRIRDGTDQRGENGFHAKLTAEQVREIKVSTKTQTELAQEYSVCRATIWDILHNKTWKHI
jgi:hypothetical protein